MLRRVALVGSLAFPASAALGLDVDDYRMVDLTHAYGKDTIYWPTAPSKFELTTLADGVTEGGFYYSAYALCSPEHGGTHLDAPAHFSESGLPNHALPLASLIAPAVVIDVSAKAAADRNYRLSAEDIRDFEARHGTIGSGTIVLLRTDWSEHWPDVAAYMGDDTPGDASRLSFPSYGLDAATLLVEARGVVMLGVDTASIDYGASRISPFIARRPHTTSVASRISPTSLTCRRREAPCSLCR